MSVIMTMRVQGDPAKFEATAKEHADTLRQILELAKSHDLIAHRFYGSDGEFMAIDEWPAPENFQAFFGEAQEQIGPLMQSAGVTSPPDVTFWHKLETGDDVGWNASA
ncbi:MAG TPA: hypothetical protein VF587_06745 [Solirubrobacteraceae bacterium]|jgi:hypothetical protein